MIESLIDRLMSREGGYVDHPDDRGGPTNYGITQATLADWRSEPVSAADVQDLMPDEARAIYRHRYWTGPGFDRLDIHPLTAEIVFDAAVNHGPRTAVRLLQRAAGVADDGLIGPITRRAASAASPRDLTARLLAHRGLYYGEIIGADPSQDVFRNGWANRLAELISRLDDEVPA